MNKRQRRFFHRRGFTLIELLTTLVVIGILVGLLIPALNLVRRAAATVRQKAQFNTISIGLEAFQTEAVFGDYPDSFDNLVLPAGDPRRESPPYFYGGAQKLAEAMVGLDGFGVHPDTFFRSDGLDSVDLDGDGAPDPPVYDATDPTNLAARLGPYLELETANAVKMTGIYSTGGPEPYNGNAGALVLADTFGKVKNLLTGKETGMPILYYKADISKSKHDAADMTNSVYNVSDHFNLFSLGAPWKSAPDSADHPVMADTRIFYDATLNPNFILPPRPYRSESFILISAGWDGLYGTGDDVYNFDTGR